MFGSSSSSRRRCSPSSGPMTPPSTSPSSRPTTRRPPTLSSSTCRCAARRPRSRTSTPRSSSPTRQERAVRLAREIHLGAQRGPHPGRGREVLHGEAMHETAKILFSSIANFARLTTCLVHLGQHQAIYMQHNRRLRAARPSCSTSRNRDVRAVQQLREGRRLLLVHVTTRTSTSWTFNGHRGGQGGICRPTGRTS